MLIFTQYVAMGRLLERHLADAGVPTLFLHGSLTAPRRDAMVERFQAGEVPVFLLSLKAGGTGLNLTGRHVVHFDAGGTRRSRPGRDRAWRSARPAVKVQVVTRAR